MLLSRQSCIKYHYLTSLPKKLLDIVLPSVVLDRNTGIRDSCVLIEEFVVVLSS